MAAGSRSVWAACLTVAGLAAQAPSRPGFRVEPEVAAVGQRIDVRCEDDLVIWMTDPSGETLSMGSGIGGPSFVPREVGVHRISGVDQENTRLEVRAFEVVPATPRWLYALGCLPLGVALLVSVARARGRVEGERAEGAVALSSGARSSGA